MLSRLITGWDSSVATASASRARSSWYTGSSTTTRLADAQRCPAFENADASTHSTARSRSASSQTTSAFFPPSSRHVFVS